MRHGTDAPGGFLMHAVRPIPFAMLVSTLFLGACGTTRQAVRAPALAPDIHAPAGPAEPRAPRPLVADADPPVITGDCRDGALAACTELDLRHLEAAGASDSAVQTARWFQGDCALGDARACLQVALALNERGAASGATRRAVDRFAAACEGRYRTGCTLIGRLLEEGELVPTDPGRARAVLALACEASQPEGCLQLARMPQDPQAAYRLYRLACDQGSSAACEEGRAFVARTGILVDIHHLDRDVDRACRLGVGAACLEAAHVVGWQHGAADFLQLGCRAGESTACLELAHGLEQGLPGHTDLARAHVLYERACSLGSKQACAAGQSAVAVDTPQ
jgi:TPR repeat protein